jgi:hypothetical protein
VPKEYEKIPIRTTPSQIVLYEFILGRSYIWSFGYSFMIIFIILYIILGLFTVWFDMFHVVNPEVMPWFRILIVPTWPLYWIVLLITYRDLII